MNKELKVIISAQVSKFKKGVQDAKSQLTGFKAQIEKAKANVDENMKKAGDAIGQGISKGVDIAKKALAGMSAAFVLVTKGTEQYRNEQAKLVTAFEAAGSSAKVAKGVYTDLYTVLGESDQAVEAANHIAQLTTNEKEMAEWTNICQGVYATFGASLPIEGLTEAANETAKVGEVTGSLADALNWAGVSEDAFNEKLAACNTEAEREALIRETLNGLYDEAAKKFEKNNEAVIKQREEQAKLQENLALMGEALAPVLTAFTQFANEALDKVVPYIQSLAEQYGPALNEALDEMSRLTGEVVGFVIDNWEIIAGIAAVIAGIAAAVGLYNAVAAVKAAMDAAQVTTLWALVSAYAAQAAAMITALAPYLLIVAAIAAVIAIIVLCIKHWDTIKATVAKVWEAMKESVANGVKAVVNWFTNMKENLSQKVTEIWTSVTGKFEEIKQGISNKIQATKEAVVNKFNEIKTGISTKISEAKTAVINKFEEIKTGVSTKVSSVFTNVKNTFDKVKSSITKPVETAKETVGNLIEKIKGFFNFEWSLPKLKMPKINIEGEFSLLPPKVPKFSISWHESGGVFDNPTLFPYGGSIHGLGENGAEAIVPLEKNTQWLDRIADRLAARSGATPIILQVDGKTFAQTSINTINQLTRQTGELQLNLY